jgi:nitrile hydratase accessory protein
VLSNITDLIPAELPANPDDERTFATPWQARAFAVAVTMCQARYYTWDEFRQCLMAEIAHDPGGHIEYYQHWLNALQKLLADKGFVAGAELDAKTRELAKPS